MHRRHFLASCAALGLTPAVFGNESTPWQFAAPIPINTQELYPCVHQQRLYVAGGIASRLGVLYFTDRCFSYDAEQDQWREEASLPEALHHAALISDGERLFCVGGFHGTLSRFWQMRAEVYELRDKQWLKVGQLPKPQAEGVLSQAPNGRLHLATGQSQRGEANSDRSDHIEVVTHLSWLPGEASWREETPIPTPRNSATGGWIGEDFVVSGGRTADGNLATTEIYNLSSKQWRSAKPIPLPQAGTASVVYKDSLLVFGGEIFVPEADVFANVWRYQVATDEWTAMPDMRTPRHGIGAGLFDDQVYVIGGATKPGGRGTTGINEVFELSSI